MYWCNLCIQPEAGAETNSKNSKTVSGAKAVWSTPPLIGEDNWSQRFIMTYHPKPLGDCDNVLVNTGDKSNKWLHLIKTETG